MRALGNARSIFFNKVFSVSVFGIWFRVPCPSYRNLSGSPVDSFPTPEPNMQNTGLTVPPTEINIRSLSMWAYRSEANTLL